MVEFYKNAISTRKKHLNLTYGDTKFLYTNNNDVFGYIRYDKNLEEEDLLILINRSENEQNITMDLDADTLEELPIKYIPKKYGELIEKEDGLFNKGLFNIQIKEKSFRIFTLKNNIEK